MILDLYGNYIGDQGAKHLAEQLRHNTVRLPPLDQTRAIVIAYPADAGDVERWRESLWRAGNAKPLRSTSTTYGAQQFPRAPNRPRRSFLLQTLSLTDFRWSRVGLIGVKYLTRALQGSSVSLRLDHADPICWCSADGDDVQTQSQSDR